MPAELWKRGPVFLICALIILANAPQITFAVNPLMTLSVTSFETGISYRDVQWHSPIGTITNPCSQADAFTVSIDWGDGTGDHKPDTNLRQQPWLLKNSLQRNQQKLKRVRKLHKRFFLVA